MKYIKPEIELVELYAEQGLIATSDPVMPAFTYDDEDYKGVWDD